MGGGPIECLIVDVVGKNQAMGLLANRAFSLSLQSSGFSLRVGQAGPGDEVLQWLLVHLEGPDAYTA